MQIKRVYWDACVFLALFGKEANRFEVCMALEKQARENKLIIYTSTATFVECVWLKEDGKTIKLNKANEEIIAKYFKHKFIQPINLDRTMAEAARGLIWQFQALKPKDAIHVASAISQMVDELQTFDDYLLKLSGKIGVATLKICKPELTAETESETLL
jgi:predicted nucleic acid-binding protein